MRAKPLKYNVWDCEHCEGTFPEADGELIKLYYHYSSSNVETPDTENGYTYYPDRGIPEEWWRCNHCGEFVEKEVPYLQQGWQCLECDGIYNNKSDADECCQ